MTTSTSYQKTRQAIAWAWGVMRLQPAMLALVVALFFASTLSSVFMPLVIRNFLASFETDFDPMRSTIAAIWMIGVGWVLFYVLKFFGMQANSYYQTDGMAHIYQTLYARVQNTDYNWHTNSLAGATVVKISRAVKGYELFTDRLYLHTGLLPIVMVAFGTTAVLAWHYPFIAFVISAWLFAGGIILTLMTIYDSGPANRRANHEESLIGGGLADRIIGNHSVKSFAREARESETLLTRLTHWKRIEGHSWRRGHIAGLINEIAVILAVASGTYLCILYYQRGAMPLSDVAMVFLTITTINSYIQQLGRIVLEMQRAINDMEDGVALNALNDESVGTQPLNTFTSQLVCKDLNFHYPEKTEHALTIPDLTIRKGDKVGLLGHSGAGKSTLIHLLTGFYPVHGDQITIDGYPLNTLKLQDLRTAIAVIPQDTALFHRSLFDNIQYGREGADRDAVIEAAKRANAHDFIKDLPDGYDTLVGERGVKLSGGQRQRIAIARAILKNAPILILDEATSALDTESEKLIQASLEDIMEDKTVIAIAHRLSTIRHLDRLIVLEQGRIIEDGSHDDLIEQNGAYARLWAMQSGGFIQE